MPPLCVGMITIFSMLDIDSQSLRIRTRTWKGDRHYPLACWYQQVHTPVDISTTSDDWRYFNFLDTLPGANESICSIRIFLHWEKCFISLFYDWGHPYHAKRLKRYCLSCMLVVTVSNPGFCTSEVVYKYLCWLEKRTAITQTEQSWQYISTYLLYIL